MTRRLARSTTRSPTAATGGADGARLARARTRATSSVNANGLPEVVVGAEVEPVDPLLDRGRRGEHEDPRGGLPGDKRRAYRVAVHPGQVPVKDDHVEAGDRRDLHRGRAVVGDVDRHALIAQALSDPVGEHPLILHHQYAHSSMVPRPA